MSKKEKLHQTDPEAEGTPEAAAAPDTFPALAELEKQLTEAQSQAAEYKDGWQRSVADFQNYRRRVDAEKAETYQNAVGNIIKRYLPILDDLERALSARPTDLAWVDGIELIYRKLQSILEAEGLKRIEAEGQMFDPNFHEAILQEPSEDHESGQIISVVQNGYMLGEQVIRPAQVRVAQ
ncbi:MAG TPA: nucleotide exchange factor GrpE [Anaerolineales bacterium]